MAIGKGEATGKPAHEPAARGQPSEGRSELARPIIRRCALRDHRSRPGDGRRMMGGWGGDGRLFFGVGRI
jgi:hypothetical protein